MGGAEADSGGEYRELFEHAHDALVVFSPEEEVVLDANRRACDLYGLGREELIGKPLTELTRRAGRWRERVGQMLERGVSANFESDYVRRDGRVSALEVNASVVTFRGGRAVLCSVRDINERRRSEEALRRSEVRSQNLEAVGRLAGGVAHEYNSLLAVIIMQADLLMMRTREDAARAKLAEIRAAADRAATLTRKLLAFSRRQTLSPDVLDLNSALGQMEDALRHTLGGSITLEVRPGRGVGRVKADPGQIEQAVQNLAANAREAMPEGGKLVIATRNAELKEVEDVSLLREPGLRPGRYVVLSVGDTGRGMDAETSAHIFEPFFTTKGSGKGAGLGLPMVYGIVAQSGGGVSVKSRPGAGSTFEIYLPRADVPEEATPAAPDTAMPEGTETVLLVEDEAMVRRVTRTLLEMCGYTVVEAGGGPEALAAARAHAGPLHLLLTDVVMPEMIGPELAPKVKELFPEVKVIYMSGYIEDDDSPHTLDGGGVLSKPFGPETLARKVRDVLDAPSRD